MIWWFHSVKQSPCSFDSTSFLTQRLLLLLTQRLSWWLSSRKGTPGGRMLSQLHGLFHSECLTQILGHAVSRPVVAMPLAVPSWIKFRGARLIVKHGCGQWFQWWCRVEGYMKSSTTNYIQLHFNSASCQKFGHMMPLRNCFPCCFLFGSLVSAQWFPRLPQEPVFPPHGFEVAPIVALRNKLSKFHQPFSVGSGWKPILQFQRPSGRHSCWKWPI